MDLPAVLREIGTWPVNERIRLVEAVWEGILDAESEPPLTDAQRAELDRRLAALEASPDDVVSWEAVQEHVRRPR